MKSTIWSHADQKDRFVILGQRAPKMSKKILGGDHWHKGAKRNTLSWSKFSILTHLVRCAEVALCRVQSAILAFWLQSATSALRFRFGTLRQLCVKFLPRIFYPFCALHDRKLRIVFLTSVRPNGASDRRATKTWVRPFDVRSWVEFSKF